MCTNHLTHIKVTNFVLNPFTKSKFIKLILTESCLAHALNTFHFV